MIPFIINPWWIHHCAGNLDPENDPYCEDEDEDFDKDMDSSYKYDDSYEDDDDSEYVILIRVVSIFFSIGGFFIALINLFHFGIYDFRFYLGVGMFVLFLILYLFLKF